eukprot:Gb_25095 [translate_table: standard]
MTYCRSISSLPEEFGNLTVLKVLIMKDCWNLCKLSQSFGNLEKLESLVIRGCNKLEYLPGSFSMLGSLMRFDASHCSLSHLPTLPESLVTLILYGCQSLAELPEFRSCHSLTEVDISGCEQVKNLAAVKDFKIRAKVRFERIGDT